MKLLKVLQEGTAVDVVYVYFQRAFNEVPHKMSVIKRTCYKRGCSSALESNKNQRVKLNIVF